MIERNKHPAGRLWNIAFGLACVADGLVRVLSIGCLHTRLPVTVSKVQARKVFENKLKKHLTT